MTSERTARGKVMDLDELARIVAALRNDGKKVALCHGCFDFMHPGHIKHLAMAKSFADMLIVTVTPDRYVDKGPNRPFFTESLRAESLAALQSVDYVGINRWPTAENTLRLLKPTYYVKGQEFERLQDKTGKIQAERDAADEVGTELRFTHEIVYSSTKLINHLYDSAGDATGGVACFRDFYPEPTREFLAAFGKRHSAASVARSLDQLRDLRVLLIGDGIVDEYYYCSTMGRSKKSPLVVYKYESHEAFAGGAFAIANHLSGICDHIQLVTLLGTADSREEFVRSKLRPNVEPKFFYRTNGPMVVKRRYIEQYVNQKAFEVNHLNDQFIDRPTEEQVIAYLRERMADYDVVLVSDFGHGFITERIIAALQESARFLAVNVQTNGANTGFNLITKYRKPHYVCLDEPEARLATQERFGPIAQVARQLINGVGMECMTITLGKSGSISANREGQASHCPVLSTTVFDTVGAGDAFFAFTAPCVAKGLPLDVVSFIGNAVGALAVQIVCNRKPVEKQELLDFIHNLLR